MLFARFDKSRIGNKHLRKIQILGIEISFIEIYISENVVRMAVSVDYDNGLVSKLPDIAPDIGKAVHGVDHQDLLIAFNNVSCCHMAFVHKMQP